MIKSHLTHGIGFGEANTTDDLASFGGRLERATGLTPWLPHTDTNATAALFPEAATADEYTAGFGGGVRGLQIAAGLDPDGIAQPDGPTERLLTALNNGQSPTAEAVYGSASAAGSGPSTAGPSTPSRETANRPTDTVAATRLNASRARRPKDGGVAAAKKLQAAQNEPLSKSPAPRPTGPRPPQKPSQQKSLFTQTTPKPVPVVPPPAVGRPVGRGGVNAPGDLLQAQRNLARVGYVRRVVDGGERRPDTGRADAQTITNAIADYQRDNGLTRDGRMDPEGPTQRRLHTQIRTQQQRLQQDAAAETGKVVVDAKAGADGTAGITNTASAQTLAARRTGARLDGTLKQKQAELAAQRQAANPAARGKSQTATATTRRAVKASQRAATRTAQTGRHSDQLTRDVAAEVADILGIPVDRLTPKMQQTIALATGPLRALTGIGQAGSGQPNPLQQALDLDPQTIEAVRRIADAVRTSQGDPQDQGAGPEKPEDEARVTPVAGKKRTQLAQTKREKISQESERKALADKRRQEIDEAANKGDGQRTDVAVIVTKNGRHYLMLDPYSTSKATWVSRNGRRPYVVTDDEAREMHYGQHLPLSKLQAQKVRQAVKNGRQVGVLKRRQARLGYGDTPVIVRYPDGTGHVLQHKSLKGAGRLLYTTSEGDTVISAETAMKLGLHKFYHMTEKPDPMAKPERWTSSFGINFPRLELVLKKGKKAAAKYVAETLFNAILLRYGGDPDEKEKICEAAKNWNSAVRKWTKPGEYPIGLVDVRYC